MFYLPKSFSIAAAAPTWLCFQPISWFWNRPDDEGKVVLHCVSAFYEYGCMNI